MGDVTQEHPEFFKAPSEHDGPPEQPAATSNIRDHETPSAESIDDLLGAPVPPILLGAKQPGSLRSNRTAAGLISLIGGLLFAILYALAVLGLIALRQSPEAVIASTLSFLATPIYWLTTALFTGSFALLAVILNRGTWRAFVIGSFFVGVLTYVAALGAGLIAIHAWELTFVEARATLWDSIAFSPLILIAPILGREIPLWLGVWISRRGKRVRDEAAVSTVSLS